MPLSLDSTDLALLRALLEDGRRSYRQLAKIANVSTPTAEARVKRLMDLGLIKKIAPIFDLEKVEQGVSAVVCLRVEPTIMSEFTGYLSSLDEVRNVFLTTGDCNIMARIACSSIEEFQAILDQKICNRPGVVVVDSHVITKTIKDEQGWAFKPDVKIQLKCDYCGGEITGAPFKLKVGERVRFLCCRTCLSSYKEKYGARLTKI